MEDFTLFNEGEFQCDRQIAIPGWKGNCPKEYQWVKRYWGERAAECRAQLSANTISGCPEFARNYCENAADFQFLLLKKGSDGRCYKKSLDKDEALKKITRLLNNRVKAKKLTRQSIASPNDVSALYLDRLANFDVEDLDAMILENDGWLACSLGGSLVHIYFFISTVDRRMSVAGEAKNRFLHCQAHVERNGSSQRTAGSRKETTTRSLGHCPAPSGSRQPGECGSRRRRRRRRPHHGARFVSQASYSAKGASA